MRHHPKIKSLAGMTLMEALVVIGIMTAILLMTTEMFAMNYNIYEKMSSKAENEAGAVIAAKTISQMTRGASSIEVSHVFGSDTITSSSTALVLKMPAIDSSDNIIDGAFDYIGFYRDDTETTKIFSVTDPDVSSARLSVSRMITDNNNGLDFRYNDPDITQADRISIYVHNLQMWRNTTMQSRGWTSIFLRNF